MNQFKIIEAYELMNQAAVDIINPVLGIEIEGWKVFNEYLGGLRPNEFTIFCGGTGIGKTQFLANLTAALIKQGVKTFCAPVETGHVDLMRRIYSIFGSFDFNTGSKPTQEMLANLKYVMQNNSDVIKNNLLVSTYDNRIDVNEMIVTLHYLNETHGVKVAILDNLNFFMKPTTANAQILEYDEVVHNFVMLAKKIPMHIILVMHPRKTELKGSTAKVISEFDIKGSATAVQEASNILLMNRLDESELENGLTPFHRELVFRKIRRRGFYVGKKFYMASEHGRYVDGSSHSTQGSFIQNRRNGERKPIIPFGGD